MPQFLTFSPTHVPGKKPYAWQKCLEGGYITIGWMHTDLTGWDIDKIVSYIESQNYDNEASAISSFRKFMALEVGDIVAANNVNAGLFGVGKVTSGYKFKLHIHDTGDESTDHFYSNYRDVDWIIKEYLPAKSILRQGEKLWPPYGTTGTLEPDLPNYIKRLLGEEIDEPTEEEETSTIIPDYLSNLINHINTLKEDSAHQERAHESLVEDLLVLLGYEKHSDIKYRQSRIDLTLFNEDKPFLLLEVKRDWSLSYETHASAVKQAYGYSCDKGIRYIVLTNGDYYAIFDRLKGLSYEKNLIGEFQLTMLNQDNLLLIEKLKKVNLTQPNLSEIFKSLSEIFD